MSSFPKTFSELKCEASWKANKFKSRSNLKFVCRNLTNPHTHLVGLKKKIKSETFLKKALTYLLIEIWHQLCTNALPIPGSPPKLLHCMY